MLIDIYIIIYGRKVRPDNVQGESVGSKEGG